MEEHSPHEKTILESLGLGVSAIGSIGSLITLLFQVQTLFKSPYLTITFLVFFLCVTCLVCITVIWRKRRSRYNNDVLVPYYQSNQRLLARIILGVNVLLSAIIIIIVYARPCLTYGEPFQEEKVGILIADFTEGVARLPTPKGKELADRTYEILKARLNISPIADNVEVRRMCAIRNEQEARKAGKQLNARLIIWGNSAEYAEGSFQPYFIATKSAEYSTNIAPPNIEFHTNDDDLPSAISANTVPLASFILGLIYLDNPRNPSDYELAIQEFTYAILQLENQSTVKEPRDEEKIVYNRTLAMYYVSRGRAYASLEKGDNALYDFQKAQDIDPGYSSIYIARGNYYYVQREFQLAKVSYQEAILKKETPTAYYGLGCAEFYLNHFEESIIAYLSAIRLLQDNKENPADIRIILATVYHEISQNDQARKQLELIVESDISTQSQKNTAQDMLTLYSVASKLPTPISSQVLSPTSTQTHTTSTIFPTKTSQSNSQHPTSTRTPRPVTPSTETLFPTKTLFPTFTSVPVPTDTIFPTITPSGPKQCNDGIDNDGDGYIDLTDPQCRNRGDNDESQ